MARKRIYRIHLDPQLCKGTEGCGICLSLCRAQVLGPAQTISMRGVHPAAVLHPEQCTGCDLCMIFCPDLAVAIEHPEDRSDE